jgi:hypothetical protein
LIFVIEKFKKFTVPPVAKSLELGTVRKIRIASHRIASHRHQFSRAHQRFHLDQRDE